MIFYSFIGELCVYDHRVSLFGAIQPGPACEMLARKDHQGFYDRIMYVPATTDNTLSFSERRKLKISQVFLRLFLLCFDSTFQADFDIKKYFRLIRDTHVSPRDYQLGPGVVEKGDGYFATFQAMNEKAKVNGGQVIFVVGIDVRNELCRGEVKGMTAKAWTNLWKLSTVYACSRSTIRNMIWGEVIDFLVTVADVESAWEVVQLSIHTMKCFKPSLKVELNESSIELSPEELVIKGAMKIKKMYELADENMEIRLTKVVKFKLYPARSTCDNFVAVSFMNFKMKWWYFFSK